MSVLEFNTFCPHAAEQKLVIEPLTTRLKTWSRTVQDLSDHFKEIEDLEMLISKIHQQTLDKLSEREKTLGIGAAVIFKPFKDLSLRVGIGFESTHNAEKTQIIKRTQLLKKQLSQKSDHYFKAMEMAQTTVEKARHAAHKELLIFEKLQVQRKRDHISPTSNHLRSDPWLDAKLVWEKIEKLVKEENIYQGRMSKIFDEIELYDGQLGEELWLILVEYKKLRENHYRNMVTPLKEEKLTEPVKHNYFEEFSLAHGLKLEQLWKTLKRTDDFSFEAPEVKILKQGLLYRPSKLGFNMWYPVLAILTETGYLHCFEMKKKDRPSLEKYKTLELQRDPSNRMATSLDVESENDILEKTHKPTLSISLANPRLTIHAVQKHGIPTFEILHQKRKEGVLKLFSLNKDEKSRYLMKALSDSDLVEWIAVLKQTADKLFPQKAPQPLFHSQEKIDSIVGEMVSAGSKSTDVEDKFEISPNDSISSVGINPVVKVPIRGGRSEDTLKHALIENEPVKL